MFSWIDWPVLTRQLLLVLVPVLVSRGILPAYLADPTTELLTYVIGTVVVGAVIAYGQSRAQPNAKIEEVAALPQVEAVKVTSDKLADSIPSDKVVS